MNGKDLMQCSYFLLKVIKISLSDAQFSFQNNVMQHTLSSRRMAVNLAFQTIHKHYMWIYEIFGKLQKKTRHICHLISAIKCFAAFNKYIGKRLLFNRIITGLKTDIGL